MNKEWPCRYGKVICRDDGALHLNLRHLPQYAYLDIHDGKGNLLDRLKADAKGTLCLTAKLQGDFLRQGLVLQAEPGNVFLVTSPN